MPRCVIEMSEPRRPAGFDAVGVHVVEIVEQREIELARRYEISQQDLSRVIQLVSATIGGRQQNVE